MWIRDLAYCVYERRLSHALVGSPRPRHVGRIIRLDHFRCRFHRGRRGYVISREANACELVAAPQQVRKNAV